MTQRIGQDKDIDDLHVGEYMEVQALASNFLEQLELAEARSTRASRPASATTRRRHQNAAPIDRLSFYAARNKRN
jgi:hypothetical protein